LDLVSISLNGVQSQELRAKLASLEEKYEALAKRFDALSGTLFQKVATEDKKTPTETTTTVAEQEETRNETVRMPPFLLDSQIYVVVGENLTFSRTAAIRRPRQPTSW
jgi:hypothetical protein